MKIRVTAENGNQKTYTVRIYRPEKPTEFFTCRDQTLGVVKNVDLVALEGYEAGEDLIFRPAEGNGPAVRYLIEPESGNTGFYLFDEKEGKVVAPFRQIRIGEKVCYPVDAPGEAPPADPSLIELRGTDWEEAEFDAWHYRDPAMKDFSIWALSDADGNTSFYRLDSREGTWQRYFPEPVPEEPEPETAEESETGSETAPVPEEETGTEGETGPQTPETSPALIAAWAAAGGGLLLSLILFILLLAARRRAKKEKKDDA